MVLLYIDFAVIFITLSNVNTLKIINGRIKISIVTTSGCSDTANFISKQLKPTYWKYRDYLEVEFVPWGRTTYNNKDGTMKCQFGPNDCWANRVHRCALALLKNQDAQVRYMTCEFSSPHPAFSERSYICAKPTGLKLKDLHDCVTANGETLDFAAREKARLPMHFINFVPAIYFNDVIDDLKAHNQAINGLESMICFALAKDPKTGVTGCEVSRMGPRESIWSWVQEMLDPFLDKAIVKKLS